MYPGLQLAEEKEHFFQSVAVPFVNKMESHFGLEGMLCFLVNKSTMEVIVGDLLFHLDDIHDCTHARALSLFEPLYDDDDAEQDKKVVTIKTGKQFSLV